MIRYKIIYVQEALDDLIRISNYIVLTSLGSNNAGKIIIDIENAIDSLNIFPERHPLIKTVFSNRIQTRRFVIKNNAVLYQVRLEEKLVVVLRIVSCRRDFIKESMN